MAGSCPTISNLKMSAEGKKSLQDIQRVAKSAGVLQKAMLGGTLASVLLSDKAIPQIFQIKMTDWRALADAIKAVPNIAKNRIQMISGQMTLRTRGKESEFWKAMYNLCMFN